uniref:Cupin type-1 domain-containing protein n=2 Tax=Sar TaxID=2698737 RepID=A0A7S3PN25_9STRA|mmetsp:Transcript_28392/g.34666  ORF Transcript_28392/g.34666 Transcript_28392/m.34666 type:complete len:308 (+) Transcript_28392:346-1269(+)|eukprot:CAMPEP_0204824874 /NCGR_PEP_ID=MMETSP1346-20131115/2844_1 /ASSEMBLY_ACC=CAM_ASM_000771 /TAXON_ID=215587 /ORGANISM="Aplanochytrium stocchinoi, Strain GSBS06" /LENGTH=307 /DNA_ID=CAMNT_0051952271 /DNA_START=264 /DNA_END=1187 /DNA_ORIENTATION=-
MRAFSLVVAAAVACVVTVNGEKANLRADGKRYFSKEQAVVGYPSEGVPILPQHLDFATGLVDSDFRIDVTARTPNRGEGGTVQARESPNTPALQGQGIALSLFTVEEGGQNLIHYHPRATELLYVITGTIAVGFTDTTGRLIENVINAGQATVFPRALLHFQRNIGTGPAQYISMLNSENPGVMSFPRVFATLPSDILAQALRTPEEIIQQAQATLVPPQLSPGGVNPTYDGAAGPNGNAPVPQVAGQSGPIPNPVDGGDPIIGGPDGTFLPPQMEGAMAGEGMGEISSLYQQFLEFIKMKSSGSRE